MFEQPFQVVLELSERWLRGPCRAQGLLRLAELRLRERWPSAPALGAFAGGFGGLGLWGSAITLPQPAGALIIVPGKGPSERFLHNQENVILRPSETLPAWPFAQIAPRLGFWSKTQPPMTAIRERARDDEH